ncbi:MAG: hypothetical protein GQF41_3703 [Candidatus Rifleibacterium amylolyticum]|nr:MAG: hypothetical protein GQF41_3703 [Candidatus Rifleibacterium amylolyticum]
MKSWMRDYSSGSVIFQEGEPGNVAFILTEGSVEITVGSGDKKKVVTVFKPVSVFGEMALVLKDQKRTATAVARSDSKVAVISKQDFDEFLEKSPKLIGVALTALVHRLRTTTERLGKTPDLFMGIAHMIDLLAQYTIAGVKYNSALSMIRYDSLVKTASQAFLVETKEVTGIIEMMETMGLLEQQFLQDTLYLNVKGKEDFLKRCVKIRDTLGRANLID